MRKKLIDVLKWLWIAAVIIGAGFYFSSHFQEISGYLGTISIPRILLSFTILFAGKILLSDITRLSLKKVGWKIPYSEALTITSITQLGKYLPGGIWHFAGKFGVYKVKGISTKQTTQAMVYENIWLLSSATVVGMALLFTSSSDVICKYLPFICEMNLTPFLLVGLPIVWVAAVILFEKVFFSPQKISKSDFALILIEQLSIWIFFGISYWLVFPPQGGFLPQIIGAFSLSWVAGYVAFFAPGGIGIREVLLTVFLGSFFKSNEVAVYASIHRMIWVALEILLGAISAAIYGLPENEEKNSAELR